MLLTTDVEVVIGGRNYNYYKNLGYEINGFNSITVPIEHLSFGSHTEVEIKCEYCQKIFSKAYKNLLNERRNSKIKKDCCSDCAYKKREEYNLIKYGVSNNFQVPEKKEKIKKTNLERYGMEYVSQSKIVKDKVSKAWNEFSDEKKLKIKEKTIQTNINNFGVEHYTKTQEYIKKKKETSLRKYGIDNFSEHPSVREKYRQTCFRKYGADNYFASDEFLSYIESYWIEKFGVSKYNKTKDFKEKMKYFWDNITEEQLKQKRDRTLSTCLERYGLEYVLQLPQTRKSLYDKMGFPTSKPQEKMFKIINNKYSTAKGNIKVGSYLLDVLLKKNKVKLAIEYDCWYWHTPYIDNRKNEFLFEKGYKILRIKSGKGMPSKDLLFYNISKLLQKNVQYSEIIMNDWNEKAYQCKKGGLYESEYNYPN